MKIKKIISPKPGEVGLFDAELRKPAENEVVVRMVTSVISPGTERASIMGAMNTLGEYPRTLGYSGAGVVLDVGAGVTRFSPGDRVTGFGLAHATVDCLREDLLIKIADGVSFEQAAFLALGVICLQGVRKARIELGEAALVMGVGPIGLLAVQLLTLTGAMPVIAADKDTHRLDVAKQCGAAYALNSLDEDFACRLREMTGGGPRIVIESTGAAAPVNLSFEIAAAFARIVLLGSTRALAEVDFYSTVHRKALVVLGAHVCGNPEGSSRPGYWTWQDDAACFMKLLHNGAVNLDLLTSDRVRYDNTTQVYNRLLAHDTNMLIPLILWE